MNFNFIKNVAVQAVPSLMTKGYFGLKNYLTGNSTGDQAIKEVSYGIAEDTAIKIGKTALKGVLGTNFIAQAATEMTVNGLKAKISGDGNVGIGLLKGGIYALNTAVVGPLGAMPLNMATDYAVDMGAKLYSKGLSNGLHTAYNNYCNYKNQHGWEALRYCIDTGPELTSTDIEDNFVYISKIEM